MKQHVVVWFAVALLSVAHAACGSSDSESNSAPPGNTGDEGGGGEGGGGEGGGGEGAGGEGTGGEGTGGEGTGGEGGEVFTLQPPADGFQIHIDEFSLDSGQEIELCQYLELGNEEDIFVSAMRFSARPGVHHTISLATTGDYPIGQPEPCFGIPDEVMSFTDPSQVPKFLFASSTQVPDERVDFPEGVAIRVPAHAVIMYNYHYINFRPEAAPAEIFLNLETVDESEVEMFADNYTFGNFDIRIPRNSEYSVTTECAFPREVNVLNIVPHQHLLGDGLRVEWYGGERDGESLYESTGWQDPESLFFEPALTIPRGQGLRFTCDWYNPDDRVVTFGPRVEDEMCFVFGYIFPATEPISGAVYSELGATQCIVFEGTLF